MAQLKPCVPHFFTSNVTKVRGKQAGPRGWSSLTIGTSPQTLSLGQFMSAKDTGALHGSVPRVVSSLDLSVAGGIYQ